MEVRKKTLIIAALGLSILLTACTFVATTKEDMEEASKGAIEAPVENAGTYEEYSPERFAELIGRERFILFFHADWCPTCRVLEKKIKKDMGVLNQHVVLEANYDREVDLKKEYGVRVQTTVIFFNEDGSIADKRINPRLSQIEEFFQ